MNAFVIYPSDYLPNDTTDVSTDNTGTGPTIYKGTTETVQLYGFSGDGNGYVYARGSTAYAWGAGAEILQPVHTTYGTVCASYQSAQIITGGVTQLAVNTTGITANLPISPAAGIVNAASGYNSGNATIPAGEKIYRAGGSTASTVTLQATTNGLEQTILNLATMPVTLAAPSGDTIFWNNVNMGSSWTLPVFIGRMDFIADAYGDWTGFGPNYFTLTAAAGSGLGTVNSSGMLVSGYMANFTLSFTTTSAGTSGATAFTLTWAKPLTQVPGSCSLRSLATASDPQNAPVHESAISATGATFIADAALAAGSYSYQVSCQ